MAETKRSATILGIADGITIVLGLLISLHSGHSSAIFHASVGAGVAELVGMGAALWLSSKRNVANFIAALLCGVATAAACILPAIPYAFHLPSALSLGLSVAICAGIGAGVCYLREEKGWLAVAETFGVLLAAAVLCFLASLI